MESKSSKTGGGRNSCGPGSGETVREKKHSFLRAKLVAVSARARGREAAGGRGRGGGEGRREEDAEEGGGDAEGKRREGDDDLISKWTAAG